ncbi:MAG: cupin domain-containing protein [Ignavibacterium sp.]|uniref:cupin domain-containing protein n=1 Tax=Ignavibacterium sp. TaxID=2651167 RepID=UPI00404B94EB
MKQQNFFSNIPENLSEEIIETILTHNNIRIERIISKGQSSPEDFWYDQTENEWILVLAGKAMIKFEEETIITLHKGDYLLIPANQKHRVEWTDPEQHTIWLAIFFN